MIRNKTILFEFKASLLIGLLLFIFFLISSELSSFRSADQWIKLLGLNNSSEGLIKKLSNTLSYMFVNLDIGQLLVNISLIGIASKNEKLIGSIRFFLIFILSGIASGLTIFLKQDVYVITGSTGAFFGVIGAVGISLQKNNLKFWLKSIAFFLLINILFQLSRGPFNPNPLHSEVNIVAHLIGFVSGCLLAFISKIKKFEP